jgi:hypothetical protein
MERTTFLRSNTKQRERIRFQKRLRAMTNAQLKAHADTQLRRGNMVLAEVLRRGGGLVKTFVEQAAACGMSVASAKRLQRSIRLTARQVAAGKVSPKRGLVAVRSMALAAVAS